MSNAVKGSARVAPKPSASPIRVLQGAVGFAVLIALFELLRLTGVLPPASVPSTIDIVRAVVDGFADGSLGAALGSTMIAWAFGILAAIAVGVPLGLAMGLSRWADGALERIVEFLRPIPGIALVPIAIVTFGIQISMQVFLIAIACAWPLLIGTRAGVRSVDPLQTDTAAAFRLDRWAVIRRVVLPSALPAIATALRVSAGLAIIVAIAAELISGSPGLGALLVSEQRAGNPAGAWACIILAGVLGVVVNVVLSAVERVVAGWQERSTEGRR